MRSALLTFLVATMAAAQYRGLAAPGDGGTLYFSEDQPLKGSTAPAQGPIYSVGGRGFALISERPAPVLPDVTPFPREYYTDYYALLRFDQSRDGTISALTGQRDCFGSSLCGVVRRYSTSVQMPGRATFPVAGAGRLSGNGRYLLTDECYPGAHPVLTDLATGEQWPTDLPSTGISTGSRVVADDGAVAYVLGPRILVRKRGTSSQHQLPFRGAEAAIDSSGRSVAYNVDATGHSGIHVFRLDSQQDATLYEAAGTTINPAISADGRRVTFLSSATADASSQLFVTEISGASTRQISADPAGLKTHVLSDDGRIAWYVSGSGRLVRVDVDSGTLTEALPAPPVAVVGNLGRSILASGSAFQVSLSGVSTSETAVRLDGITAPVIRIGGDGIMAQAPWEVRNTLAKYEVTSTSPSPFSATLRGQISVAVWLPYLMDPIHQDWSGLVTAKAPAKVGEVVHFYATGLGDVEPPVPTGQQGTASPLSRTSTPYLCNAPVLFSGLAPGLTGYYQVSLQIPSDARPPAFTLSCRWSSFSPFTSSIPVAP